MGKPAEANFPGFERVAPLVKNAGKIIVALAILDLALNSDAYAQGIVGHMKMFSQDCQRGKDDWAYVDLLMMRHDLNQLALFSGDVAMRGMLKKMDKNCK